VCRLALRWVARALLQLHQASRCLGSSRGSSSTTSIMSCDRVPRLLGRLVVDYFAYVVRPSALAPRAARRRLLRLCHASRTGLTSTSRRLVALATTCAWSLRLMARLLVARLHRLYCAYVLHSDAPSRLSTSYRSVALALAVRVVIGSRSSTTCRLAALALLRLCCASESAISLLDNSTPVASTVCTGSKAKSFI
jgi:hypothetical protein